MARRYSTAESTVRSRLAERTTKKNKSEWASAPRYWADNGEIYLCNNCTVSLLRELGVSLETIAQCKRFDWRKASVETIEAFERMGGWLGDILPNPEPAAEPAAKTAAKTASESSDDTKQLLKAIAGMAQQMEAQGKAIASLYKMVTE